MGGSSSASFSADQRGMCDGGQTRSQAVRSCGYFSTLCAEREGRTRGRGSVAAATIRQVRAKPAAEPKSATFGPSLASSLAGIKGDVSKTPKLRDAKQIEREGADAPTSMVNLY